MDRLDIIFAIEAIKQLKARYMRTMDTKNWDEFRTLLAEDIIIDTSASFTPCDYAGNRIEIDRPFPEPIPKYYMVGRDAFIAAQHHYLDGVSTVHHSHTPEIEIVSPTEATGVWAMEDKLRWPLGSPTRTMHGYGHYRETYRKNSQGWVIQTIKLTRVRMDVVLADGSSAGVAIPHR